MLIEFHFHLYSIKFIVVGRIQSLSSLGTGKAKLHFEDAIRILEVQGLISFKMESEEV